MEGARAETEMDVQPEYQTVYQVNRVKEPQWLAYVVPLVLRSDPEVNPIRHRLLVAMAARHCDISIRTSERYLEKHSAPNGPLEVVHDKVRGLVFVRIRSSYWAPAPKVVASTSSTMGVRKDEAIDRYVNGDCLE